MDSSEAGTPPGGTRATQVVALFREHNAALVGFLRARLNSLADAQEVAQEVYLKLLSLDGATVIDSPRAFLFRAASNLAVDRLRMRNVRASAPADPDGDNWHATPIPEQHASAHEQWRDLRQALDELPPKTSRAFVMHVIEGRDFATIAREMNLSERMVRYHVGNALAHCRERRDRAENFR
ncbi:RNA polymerase sigma-70 factor (ECF subfamily) [Luteibacter jiangsuensis]|uniref:RNA polymerase sigma-70 factor (ECF subfamily) n=1 Tax=Luteibacter jiangsuensis TaxID=637577 RepID=A0ABT9SYS3_9GAMM|nr:sigma-70 family RNA polymerase sigma factor [Luteibacter jiangsuensis]MDQ0009132.1 RNA polymerase sigma-70 factor (ECF subfamily) [Luteibacter jiangsuensis]